MSRTSTMLDLPLRPGAEAPRERTLRNSDSSPEEAVGERPATPFVELTIPQLARIGSLSEDCVVVGVRDGCPLLRVGGGHLALLQRDGRLAPAQARIRVVTPYMEVASA
jgi:hypothetical protein